MFTCLSLLGVGGERGKMVSLQGPVICPAVRSKQFGVYMPPANGPFPRAKLYRSDIWGYRGITDGKNKARAIFRQLKLRKCRTTVQCSFSSSSDGNGSMAENFNENDEDYVNSSVLEAGMWMLIQHLLFLLLMPLKSIIVGYMGDKLLCFIIVLYS